MDFLIDPNIAYLALVIGFALAIMAMTAPGTGILEVLAFALLIFAGFEIANQPFNLWALILLVVGVVPFIYAVRKSGKWYYLLAATLAFIIGSVFLFSSDVWWQPVVNPILATIVSILIVGFFWIVVRKGMEALRRQPSNTKDLTKLTGVARTEIHHEGSVYVGGEEWSAHSKKPIAANTQVKVISKQGFILEVEEIKDN
jgi:membrane-bound serine protease (ClpP class)